MDFQTDIFKKLFEDQINGNAEFPEAENIILNLQTSENKLYKITTSENLIKKDEVVASEWERIIDLTEGNLEK